MSNAKLWTLIVVGTLLVGFGFGYINNKLKSNDTETVSDSEVNLNSESDVLNYVQGKWQLAYYPQAGLTIHVRLLIEGNTIKTWSSVNDYNNENDFNWDMNKAPDETYNFKVGELTAKGAKRYLEWDNNGDLTLQQRAIGDLFVANTGFHYGVSYWMLSKGWK